ncbi:MAG: DUF2252 family protein [Bacteroidia bacterium]|nr:DUF2252 family protein [Bacteroidia bacterium]
MPASIIHKIKEYDKGRVPGILALKYKAMREDKYRFLRAIPYIFYEDVQRHSFLHDSPNVWLCGDLHLENLGSYKGDNRIAYFDINDFDECLLGPCLLDIARMLTSILVASTNLNITRHEAHSLCRLFTVKYFDMLKQGYIRDLEKQTTKGAIRQFLRKVQRRKRKSFLKQKTVTKNRKTKILIDHEHTIALKETEKRIVMDAVHSWAKKTAKPDFYKVKDVAFRIAGTSSLGIKRYVALIEGRGAPNGCFLIDLKETTPPCAEKFIHIPQPKWKSDANRIVEVQKRILSVPPALLAPITIGGKDYVLKEMQPAADRIDYTMFHGNLKKLKNVLENMGAICAWSNLRSSGRQGSAIADELISFARNEKGMVNEVMDFARGYSKTIDGYYSQYCNAYDKGYFSGKN